MMQRGCQLWQSQKQWLLSRFSKKYPHATSQPIQALWNSGNVTILCGSLEKHSENDPRGYGTNNTVPVLKLSL